MTSPPSIFDCVELNDRYRHVDVIDDIASLVTDLDMRERSDIGRSLWSLLAERLDESGDEPLFDFYRSYRATFRARVEGLVATWQAAARPERRIDLSCCQCLALIRPTTIHFLLCRLGL